MILTLHANADAECVLSGVSGLLRRLRVAPPPGNLRFAGAVLRGPQRVRAPAPGNQRHAQRVPDRNPASPSPGKHAKDEGQKLKVTHVATDASTPALIKFDICKLQTANCEKTKERTTAIPR